MSVVQVELREKRPSSAWRKSAYRRLCMRDGEVCSKCERLGGKWCQRGGRHLISFDPAIWASRVIFRPVLEVDHRVPLYLGGANDDDNLWLLCHWCHKKKTSKEQSERLKALSAGRNA